MQTVKFSQDAMRVCKQQATSCPKVNLAILLPRSGICDWRRFGTFCQSPKWLKLYICASCCRETTHSESVISSNARIFPTPSWPLFCQPPSHPAPSQHTQVLRSSASIRRPVGRAQSVIASVLAEPRVVVQQPKTSVPSGTCIRS